MRILGIDPGLAIVGFGLIEAETGKTQMLQYGAVTTPAGFRSPRGSCSSSAIWRS